ncbi:glycosyltransferase family 1 protein [Cystobasidium minutum MCA 4210]|uniref:glycosyltransferase family 1 protein n=1 Tax=Cystobasidium minutum MCA 4210 TaxID=1397322 RepID=UPI0034CE4FA9|eukprot:jgi/Rhomi1/179534/fgenesh1_pg.3_\
MANGSQSFALLTVGSTHFDELVKAALEPTTLEAMFKRGITRFVVQYGQGDIRQILRNVALEPVEGFPVVSGGVSATVKTSEGVEVQMYAFMDDIEDRMANASLVISHAGAGSILAALRGPALSSTAAKQQQKKQLVIVPNDSLMDSHQSELAEEMAKHGWAAIASPRTLAETIQQLPTTAKASSAFPAHDPSKIQSILDEQMGWT